MSIGFEVRKCCSPGYTWHSLDTTGAWSFNKLPQCNCEIVASNLNKEEAMKLGIELSEKYNVPLEVDKI